MSWYDFYNQRMKTQGKSIADTQRMSTKQMLNNTFKDSPFYKPVIINNNDIDARLVDTNVSFVKELQFLPDTTINNGDMCLIDNDYWLVYDFISNELFPKATIWKCNMVLKYKNEDGFIIEIPCVIAKDPIEQFDINKHESKSKFGMNLLDGGYLAYVSYNYPDIDINKRFMIGKLPYKVTGYHVALDNIVLYTLSIDLLSESDDLVNGIADNTSNNYKIEILNGDFINVRLNEPIIINAQLYNNDFLVNNAIFTLTSESNNITIDNMTVTGIETGEAILRLTYQDDPLIFKDIKLNIQEELLDSYQLKIYGDSSGAIRDKISLNTKLFNNGVEVTDFSVIWDIDSDISRLSNVSDNTCDVILGTEENEVFKVTAIYNENIVATHTIEVVGLWG